MDNEDQSRSDQAKASQGGDLMAEKKTRDLYEDTRAGPSYCDKMIGHAVDARIFESACLDYDSDDSVKDKTYEPHKDILDDSYVSDSPEKVFVISRSLKVKRKLSFSEESPQRQKRRIKMIRILECQNVSGFKLNMTSPEYYLIKIHSKEIFAKYLSSEMLLSGFNSHKIYLV
ncbi:unnamed protein product [Parnassius apollo]|uniref:(apollo) hypothetical protein n=1 Tax=Parnassius apollo TaxID=110799 RepID=A0A8S3X296_PARAO|nr:unnamed protein product [Parnassius apollo]